MPADLRQRRRLRARGVVQGVGFRPFVYGLASRYGLAGSVVNDGEGVVVEAEGTPPALDGFTLALTAEAPSLARVDSVETELLPPSGEHEFVIAPSTGSNGSAEIPPDTATCEDCLRELFDPLDRRYRYPFLNCTRCGPRLTIVRQVPYDRANTTMACFPLCPDCRREYDDPSDRRFHAEPIACPRCGPRLTLHPGGIHGEDALAEAVAHLRAGAIVAVKGIGGYHLACDAACQDVVLRLRARKLRDEKPFAVLTSRPAELVELTAEEEALLAAPARPILLAPRRATAAVAPSVAPGSPWLGVMLPYSPLHHLLSADFGGPLVLTSGNRGDEPIATDDDEARRRLDGIADAFLIHDRAIHRRCEDSVVRAGSLIRRSRGYAPAALPLPRAAVSPILAVGAELKSTFCVAVAQRAVLSPHLGDLHDELAYDAFAADLGLYLGMLDVTPPIVACDLHPDYLSTKWAAAQEADVIEVQHHHAHAAACLAEHGEEEPALALVFDGTGYGTDGTLWGGELLRFDLVGFERLAHLEPLPLAGGEAAVREPWRIAATCLELSGRRVPWEGWRLVRESLKLEPPLSSGMGRLFDAAAAVLGVRDRISYEGQAALELEQLAADVRATPFEWTFGDSVGLVARVHDELAAGRARSEIAAAFHETIAAAAATVCTEAAAHLSTVVLSGGSFQNRRLLAATRRRLENHGFRVLTHRLVPPNDGGISYGQAAVAAARTA
jgi:hydrogenase maturation protein HypF